MSLSYTALMEIFSPFISYNCMSSLPIAKVNTCNNLVAMCEFFYANVIILIIWWRIKNVNTS